MIETQFHQLLSAIETCFPCIREELNPPADEADLRQLRDSFDIPLPKQLVELLGIANGQSSPSPYALGGFSFYSTSTIQRMRVANNFNNSNPCWIPIGGAEPFELIIDANPDLESNGQLFIYDAESSSHPPIAESLSQYLELTTSKIDAGDFRKLLKTMMIHHDPLIAE